MSQVGNSSNVTTTRNYPEQRDGAELPIAPVVESSVREIISPVQGVGPSTPSTTSDPAYAVRTGEAVATGNRSDQKPEQPSELEFYLADGHRLETVLDAIQNRQATTLIRVSQVANHYELEALFNAVRKSSHLRDFSCSLSCESDQTLKYHGASAALAIAENKLESLGLGDIKLSAPGWKILGMALGTNTSLKTLRLNRMNLDKENMKFLSSGLRKNSHINNLLINGIKLNDTFNEIAGILSKNTGLRKLTLYLSDLPVPTTVSALMSGMRAQQQLNSLTLDFPDDPALSRETLMAFIAMLKQNTQLRYFEVGSLTVVAKDVKKLIPFLESTSVRFKAGFINVLPDNGKHFVLNSEKQQLRIRKREKELIEAFKQNNQRNS